MTNTRREFLQSGTALAIGLMGGAAAAPAAQSAVGPQAQNIPQGAQQTPAQSTGPSGPNSKIQVPKMKFGDVEISRLVLGHNPLYGFAHYNSNFTKVM